MQVGHAVFTCHFSSEYLLLQYTFSSSHPERDGGHGSSCQNDHPAGLRQLSSHGRSVLNIDWSNVGCFWRYLAVGRGATHHSTLMRFVDQRKQLHLRHLICDTPSALMAETNISGRKPRAGDLARQPPGDNTADRVSQLIPDSGRHLFAAVETAARITEADDTLTSEIVRASRSKILPALQFLIRKRQGMRSQW